MHDVVTSPTVLASAVAGIYAGAVVVGRALLQVDDLGSSTNLVGVGALALIIGALARTLIVATKGALDSKDRDLERLRVELEQRDKRHQKELDDLAAKHEREVAIRDLDLLERNERVKVLERENLALRVTLPPPSGSD